MKISNDDFKNYMEEARKHSSLDHFNKAKAFAPQVVSKIQSDFRNYESSVSRFSLRRWNRVYSSKGRNKRKGR